MSCGMVDARGTCTAKTRPLLQHWHWSSYSLRERERKTSTMTKTLDLITEIIRNPKHPFRKADDRAVKAHKHRYERRKVKEYIRLGDWGQQSPA